MGLRNSNVKLNSLINKIKSLGLTPITTLKLIQALLKGNTDSSMIKDYCGITGSTTSKYCKTLEEAGYVNRLAGGGLTGRGFNLDLNKSSFEGYELEIIEALSFDDSPMPEEETRENEVENLVSTENQDSEVPQLFVVTYEEPQETEDTDIPQIASYEECDADTIEYQKLLEPSKDSVSYTELLSKFETLEREVKDRLTVMEAYLYRTIASKQQ